jgi:predicted acetyltransferase
LTDFCASYNQEKVQAHLRLTKIKADEFVISFPQNIDFEIYCYMINYLNYPAGFNKTFKPFGYTTTKLSDHWITEETANKEVMLFISDHDTEYDNVSMTTSENIGYKLSFDHSHTSKNQLLDAPEKNYTPHSVSLNQLKLKEFSGFA